jgi:hypothetical protein
MMLIWGVVAMTALMAIVSLAIDLGRVQLAKTELQRAADAAARYAATGIVDSTYLEKAQDAAEDNLVDGTALSLYAEDVRSGNWDSQRTPQFDPSRSPTNAIEITARRTAQRGNAVPLLFAQVLGLLSIDIESRTVVLIDQGTDVTGLVGIDTISMNGGTVVDSYDSSYGVYPGGVGDVSLASNGDIYLYDTASVSGGAHPGPGRQVYLESGVTVSSTAPLSASLSYSPPNAGSFATNNDNSNVPPGNRPNGNFRLSGNQSLTLPGGNYYFNDFDMSGSTQLVLTGPATFWLTGELRAAGTISTDARKPANLQVRLINGGDVTFSGNSSLAADVYAPLSAITINGNPDISGALIGKSLTIIGNARIHVDRSLLGLQPITWNRYATVK